MSINCVDAAIELSNENDIPIMLIASRRQIDSNEFGGGYVNNWTTEEFSKYVCLKDKKSKIILCRDHGGPWQNPNEVNNLFDIDKAMLSAKKSFKSDIKSDFKIIHIDPSIDINGTVKLENALDRLFDLYSYCCKEVDVNNKEILFEIGTEEQSGSTNSKEELEFTLNEVQKFCTKEKLPFPSFVVIQSGTRVMEMRNVGSFDSFALQMSCQPKFKYQK